ncbi:MAG: hypothetical protein MUP90_06675 [Gammaproteobacteria bacterium]|nr:hypothetical protein [Gammaproteobacteria bacterium]
MAQLQSIDWAVIGLCFVAVFAGVFVVTRQASERALAEGYSLGGRNSGWFVIRVSLFASDIGSGHLVGPAGTAA